jgi:fructokinase
LEQMKVIGIGELLWDMLPGGKQVGGAPANFAYHASALGADAQVISRVGKDELGRELLSRLNNLAVPVDCIQVDPALPTGTVTVKLAADGQPQYIIHENVAWDAITAEPTARAATSAADAICIGTLAQRDARSGAAIQALVASTPPNALRILDVNFRQRYFSEHLMEESLALANAVKVNDAELPVIARMFGLGDEMREQMEKLAERFKLRLVACTRGSKGSLLYANGNWSEHPGVPVKIVDTIGAGDSFTAAMTLGFLSGWNLNAINQRASEVAAVVCAAHGATPPLPKHLRFTRE